jgi:DNA-binding MarR family transcriptional regulator
MARRWGPRRAAGWGRILSDPAGKPPAEPSHAQLLFRLFNEIGIIDQLTGAAFGRLLPHGLTRAQFAVLNHCVRMGDNKTPAQLAAILQVTRGTMTSTLARLEEKGFVAFDPDAADGRSKRVVLTRKGRAAREASIHAALPFLAEAAGAIPRDMVERLLPQMEIIRAWLDRNRLD